VVVIVNTSVAGEAAVGFTDEEANVQLAPVGQPPEMDRLTVPVNPFCDDTLMVVVPGWPGAEIVTAAGFAVTPKSVTAREVADEVEVA
jgi:hypothetical protein